MGLLPGFQYCFLNDRGRGRRFLRDHPVLAEDVIPAQDSVSICYVERSVKDNTTQYQHLDRPQEHLRARPLWKDERGSMEQPLPVVRHFCGYLISQPRSATKTTTGDLALCIP